MTRTHIALMEFDIFRNTLNEMCSSYTSFFEFSKTRDIFAYYFAFDSLWCIIKLFVFRTVLRGHFQYSIRNPTKIVKC